MALAFTGQIESEENIFFKGDALEGLIPAAEKVRKALGLS
jgi:hypothetical protein